MRRRIVWLLVTCLIVVAMLLGSCSGDTADEDTAPVETEEQAVEEEQEVVEEQEEGPQYGGRLTFIKMKTGDQSTFGMRGASAFWTNEYTGYYLDRLISGDVEKYGPRGTNEHAFKLNEFLPLGYAKGELAESWEISPDGKTIIFHLRQGIMWTGNDNLGMEPREFTAYDVETSQMGLKTMPGYETRYELIESIEALDRYTVQYKLAWYDANWAYMIAWGAFPAMVAPETIESDNPNDWRNAVGTGPFIITNHVKDSAVYLERNPNYWGTTTINGKEYQTPFIDELVVAIIADESTKVAALRTGQVDIWPYTPLLYEETLSQNNPDIIKEKYLSGASKYLALNARDGGILENRELRRALMIALDLQTIVESIFIESAVHTYPFSPALPQYTPIEELPESAQVLFSYDPELASQMIIDEGYENGFTVELVVGEYPEWDADAVSFITEYWNAVGVEVDVKVLDKAAVSASAIQRLYKDVQLYTGGTNNPYLASLWMSDKDIPRTFIDDDYATDLHRKALRTPDLVEQTKLLKELGVYLVDQAVPIPFGNPTMMVSWWPWMRNYYGEIDQGTFSLKTMFSTLWIDQEMKANMGY